MTSQFERIAIAAREAHDVADNAKHLARLLESYAKSARLDDCDRLTLGLERATTGLHDLQQEAANAVFQLGISADIARNGADSPRAALTSVPSETRTPK